MSIKLQPKSYELLKKYLLFSMKTINEEIIRAFSILGEQCVTRVRDRSKKESWYDQTGNLRSSIGYAVYTQGRKVIESSFKQVLQGSEGVSVGRDMINDLAKMYSDTYALVVIAGMSYAEYVEAKDNKDVLASTRLWAESKVEEYLKNALERANKKINQAKL